MLRTHSLPRLSVFVYYSVPFACGFDTVGRKSKLEEGEWDAGKKRTNTWADEHVCSVCVSDQAKSSTSPTLTESEFDTSEFGGRLQAPDQGQQGLLDTTLESHSLVDSDHQRTVLFCENCGHCNWLSEQTENAVSSSGLQDLSLRSGPETSETSDFDVESRSPVKRKMSVANVEVLSGPVCLSSRICGFGTPGKDARPRRWPSGSGLTSPGDSQSGNQSDTLSVCGMSDESSGSLTHVGRMRTWSSMGAIQTTPTSGGKTRRRKKVKNVFLSIFRNKTWNECSMPGPAVISSDRSRDCYFATPYESCPEDECRAFQGPVCHM